MPYETNLWGWLRAQAKPLIAAKKLHICRVENWVVPGFPDVEGCFDGDSFHIELKGALRPARRATRVRVKWQPGQRPWLSRRWAAGGSAFVLLRVGIGASVRNYLIRGDQANLIGQVPESALIKMSLTKLAATGIEVLTCAAKWRKENGI